MSASGKCQAGPASALLSPNLELAGGLNPEPIIHGVPEPLLASQVFLRSLH